MSDQAITEAHHNKNVTITPETSVSVGVLALIVGLAASLFGLIIGGALSYGSTSTKIDFQGQQIQQLTEAVKLMSTNFGTLTNANARQEEVNKKFSESLIDIKSLLINQK